GGGVLWDGLWVRGSLFKSSVGGVASSFCCFSSLILLLFDPLRDSLFDRLLFDSLRDSLFDRLLFDSLRDSLFDRLLFAPLRDSLLHLPGHRALLSWSFLHLPSLLRALAA